jgi:hypothetical protein
LTRNCAEQSQSPVGHCFCELLQTFSFALLCRRGATFLLLLPCLSNCYFNRCSPYLLSPVAKCSRLQRSARAHTLSRPLQSFSPFVLRPYAHACLSMSRNMYTSSSFSCDRDAFTQSGACARATSLQKVHLRDPVTASRRATPASLMAMPGRFC